MLPITAVEKSLWVAPRRDCTLGKEVLNIWAWTLPLELTMSRESAERCEMWTKERGPGVRERKIEKREATRKQ